MTTFKKYILCIWCDILKKNGLNLFIFGTVIRYHVLLMHVKWHLSLPDLSNYGAACVAISHISEKNGLIVFIFDTVIKHNRDLMHVTYTLALCQN